MYVSLPPPLIAEWCARPLTPPSLGYGVRVTQTNPHYVGLKAWVQVFGYPPWGVMVGIALTLHQG